MPRNLTKPQQNFDVIDDKEEKRCYLVCWTKCCDLSVRITSVVCDNGKIQHRILRSDYPKLWVDIRSKL